MKKQLGLMLILVVGALLVNLTAEGTVSGRPQGRVVAQTEVGTVAVR